MIKEYLDIYDGTIRLDAVLTKPEAAKEKMPLCIIIHGFTGQKDEDHLMAVEREVLSIGMASLRVDMYGHGKSDGEFRDHTLSKWFLNLLAIVDYAEKLDFVDGIFLCGHSQGGLTVMMGAAMLRDRIRGLIPMSPAWFIPDQARGGSVLGLPFDENHIPEEIYLPDSGLTLGGRYLREAQLIFVKEAVSRYEGPVLIVHGEEDKSVPYHYSEEILSCYQDVELVPIPGDTHCFDHHADQAARAVREWLEKEK